MNSSILLVKLDEIGNVSGRNEKQSMLNKLVKDDFVKSILVFAYNSLLNYGILPTSKHDKMTVKDGGLDFKEMKTFEFLNALIERRLTGNNAEQELENQLKGLDENSAKLLIRILRKDLKGGFAESAINKAVAGLLPEFPYMRCSLQSDIDLKKWNWERGILSQEKADGMFASISFDGGDFLITSRQGSKFSSSNFKNIIAGLPAEMVQYHGELLVERDGEVLPREIGNGILNSVLKGGLFAENEKPIYVVWDVVPLSHIKTKGSYDAPYLNRLKMLNELVKDADDISIIDTKIVRSLSEAYSHFQELVSKGKEGTIIKQLEMKWRDGTSKEQVKLKVEADCELEITAINNGKIGSKNENKPSSLTCVSSCGKLVVDVAVKNEKMRKSLEKNADEWLGKIITVRGNQVLSPSESNANFSLFLPRMVEDGYRHDKSIADDLERIQKQYNDVIK